MPTAERTIRADPFAKHRPPGHRFRLQLVPETWGELDLAAARELAAGILNKPANMVLVACCPRAGRIQEGQEVAERGDSTRLVHPLFQEDGGGSTPTSPLQLRFILIDLDRAVDLNKLWHSRLPVVKKSNIVRNANVAIYGAEFGGTYYAVAIWTSPVARRLPQEWLELRRFAIAPDAPRNTASRMLGWMASDIRRRLPGITTLVSYQDKEVHTGTIYRASGWAPVVLADPRSRPWNNASRPRNQEQSTAEKQRWQKVIRQD